MKLKHRLEASPVDCLTTTGWCRAQISVGGRPIGKTLVSYYVIEKAGQQSTALKSKMLLSGADAVKKLIRP